MNLMSLLSFSSLSRLIPRYQRRQVNQVDLTNNAFIAKSRDFSRSLAKWNDAQHYTYSDNSDPSSADQAFSSISSSTSSPSSLPPFPLRAPTDDAPRVSHANSTNCVPLLSIPASVNRWRRFALLN